MAITNFLANQIANATVRNVSYTSPASVYAALYSVAPTGNTAGTELTGNGYSRQLTTFSSPVGGIAASNVAISFGAATGNNWPAAVAVGIVDSATSGNLMYYSTIASRIINIGDTLDIDSGQLTISIT